MPNCLRAATQKSESIPTTLPSSIRAVADALTDFVRRRGCGRPVWASHASAFDRANQARAEGGEVFARAAELSPQPRRLPAGRARSAVELPAWDAADFRGSSGSRSLEDRDLRLRIGWRHRGQSGIIDGGDELMEDDRNQPIHTIHRAGQPMGTLLLCWIVYRGRS